MVVLSVAVGTKDGKLLLARDFCQISRTLVEDCAKSLPKLISQEQQHTFVEHGNLRLNYLPLDNLYIIAINDKRSNILEDTEVVRTLKGVLSQVLVEGISEEQIYEKSIDLLLAIDDVISLGQRNIFSENNILSALKMESSNEKMHQEMMKTYETQAKKNQTDFFKKLRNREIVENGVEGGSQSIANDKGVTNGIGSDSTNLPSYGGSSTKDILADKNDEDNSDEEKTVKKKSTKKGLVLGTKKKKKNEKIAKKKKQEALSKKKEEVMGEEAVEFNPLDAAIKFYHEEILTCEIDKDGKMSLFNLRGTFNFEIMDPQRKRVAICLKEYQTPEKVSLKVPPSFNKSAWSGDNVIVPKNEQSKFNIRTKIPTIKYKFNKSKGDYSPFTLNTWFSDGTLTAEVELNTAQNWITEMKNITIKFSVPETEPAMEEIENSEFEFVESEKECIWKIAILNEDTTEANISLTMDEEVGESELFPWNVEFEVTKPCIDLKVLGVKCLDTDEDLRSEESYIFKTENFVINN